MAIKVNSSARQEHLLQSETWGKFKSGFGWTTQKLRQGEATVQVLFRRLPLGLSLAYVPKGPAIDWAASATCRALFLAMHNAAKERRAIFLKVEPDVWHIDTGNTPGQPDYFSAEGESHRTDHDQAKAAIAFLSQAGFTPADTIQPRTSLVIDVSGDEASILAAMKQKTRYNIRLAQKRNVTVRQGGLDDVTIFYQLSQTTASRDGFGVHSLAYYRTAFQMFAPDRCALLIAEFEGQPLAALMVFSHGNTVYYLYGASANEYRELMPTYLVQWAAIRWAKNRGCTRYDLWGVPDADAATLEAEFRRRREGLWGVYRFKRGFGGQVIRSIGAYDYVYNKPLYKIYQLRRSLL